MLKYGRKIIQYLFKKRQKCHGIRVVFASRSEADCDRSIFECLRLGYPLNNMEITSKARELLRKRAKGSA